MKAQRSTGTGGTIASGTASLVSSQSPSPLTVPSNTKPAATGAVVAGEEKGDEVEAFDNNSFDDD